MMSGIYRSPGSSKCLQILDLLSVLLVSESPGGTAAISIYRAASEHIEVWYSKGRPSTKAEKASVVNFIRSAVEATLVSRPETEHLLRIALDMCKYKVFARIYQARQLLLQLCLDGTYGIIPSASYADRDLRDAAKIELRGVLGEDELPPERSLERCLTLWFQDIILAVRPGVPFDIAANVEFYFQTVVRCYALLKLPRIDTMIESDLLEKLRKVSEYYTAVSFVHWEVQKLSPGGKAHLISSIREIPPSAPTTCFTPLDPLICLSNWAYYRGLTPPFPFHPSLPALPNQSHITECTHPEATLITKIISTHKSSPAALREIGASKASCWICQEFLAAARGLYPNISIRLLKERLRTAGSWKFPAGTPVELVRALTRRIEKAMGEVLEECDGANGVKGTVKRKFGGVEG
ncbi:hypothetical protein B9Z19DRAFT_1101313 [Tuber borchii]|uniref:Uncharacterized protein n=1 Tax=Tuber borchii TaxID=42251 RepID=A0A2T6ZSV7_TUBBO|nr:hypothetical protein B9Z19DRAFT_1101313 [Tuber borchii]